MDLVNTVRKEGSRGGRGDFKWSDVQSDQHRENYLGHSLMAPVGRWQRGKDLQWYSRNKTGADDEADDLTPEERARKERQEEIARIKQAEREALNKALGYELNDEGPPGDKSGGTGANATAIAGNQIGREEEKQGRHDKKERKHRQRDRSRDRDSERRQKYRRQRSRSRSRSREHRRRDRSRSRSPEQRHRKHRRRDHSRDGRTHDEDGRRLSSGLRHDSHTRSDDRLQRKNPKNHRARSDSRSPDSRDRKKYHRRRSRSP